SFWVGAALGSLGSSLLLTPGLLPADSGWRFAFGIGASIGLIVLVFRTALPESPRWLLLHGRSDEAEQIVATIESKAGVAADAPAPKRLKLLVRAHATNLVDLGVSLFRRYPRRAVLGLVLMASQAFCYNAIFFTYALVLDRFFHVPAERVGWYLLPFSVTNFLGPLALGWLFDHWGRRPMISGSYAVTGVLRALAIAVFYAFGTALGGIAAPWVFGTLIGTGDPQAIAGGYFFGAALMVIAAIVEVWLGVAAERRSLEEVARPLSSV